MADTSEDTLEGIAVTDGKLPAIRLSSGAKPEVEKRVALFYIDDVEYTVPEKPSPRNGLRYLWLLAKKGESEANFFLLSSLLGDKGYAALMNYKPLTDAQYNEIMNLAVKISLGNREIPKANQRRATQNGSTGSSNSSGRRRVSQT
jgi:hypothetical protein